MMYQLIKKFPEQLKEAIGIGELASIGPHHFQIHNIIVAGMGGSGIGGALVADMIADDCRCPFIVINSYKLPAYVNKHTLVIVSSYSGNTEETISALEDALKKDSKIVCITSGGKIRDMALQNGLDIIALPSGLPSPRTCVGYSMVQQLYILFSLGLILKSTIDSVKIASDLLSFEQDDIMVKAEKLAPLLINKMPVIYTTDRAESVAIRWRQQLNENAKILCWHHVIPEMNHNELVGWRARQENISVLFLRYKDEIRKNQLRTDLTKQIISPLANNVIEIYAKGQTLPEKMLYLLHLGDWLSWYLAQNTNIDASEVQMIDFLKAELDNLSI
ncbi:MAG: bifunctional phosphoglucose/phosphomannose isomerase [Saprospiraceae bacterium]|nr:bifunctional phosphoglucose/phosphomannose isomerase [Saprospiraceae bacterium]